MQSDQRDQKGGGIAWQQAFGLLAFGSHLAAASIVVAGYRDTDDEAERGQWIEIADCLNAISGHQTQH